MHIASRAQSSHKLLRYQLRSTLAQMSAINVQEFVAVPNLQTESGLHIASLGAIYVAPASTAICRRRPETELSSIASAKAGLRRRSLGGSRAAIRRIRTAAKARPQ